MPEIVKNVGTLLGYVATAIGLLTLFWTRLMKKQRSVIIRESGKEKLDERVTKMDKKLDALADSLQSLVKTNTQFQEKMNLHIETQNNTNKKLLASIIEQTYYANRDKKALDMNEFRRITETYEIYHGDEIHGNSYISALYDEMMTWERLG